VSEFGDQLGPKARFSTTPETPTVGEPIEFDASDSQAPGESILSYSWSFSDGATAAGEVTTHTFLEPGNYDVTLQVVDSSGSTLETTSSISIESETATTEDPSTSTPSSSDPESTTTGGQGPGFGIGAAISGVAAALYVIKRRFE
jgi:PKD repeat protein